MGGVEALLSGLNPMVDYTGGVLKLEKSHEAVIEPAGRGIILVPCIFSWPRVEVLVQPGYRPTLAYGPAVWRTCGRVRLLRPTVQRWRPP
jgi:hypothetical protein